MPRKYDLITELYRRTLGDITKDAAHWQRFLECAAFQYKYSFNDAVLIYAQRPNATACAELETWNTRLGRWVNTGAKGIALFDENNYTHLRYVFDVSDTHERYDKPFEIWAVRPEYEGEIMLALENRYGDISLDMGDARLSLMRACINATVDNIGDYASDLSNVVENSRLKDMSDDEIRSVLLTLTSASITYAVFNRLGYDTTRYIGSESFDLIGNFNTTDTQCILGYAVSDISEMILRDIEKTVRSCKKQNRTFDKADISSYNESVKEKNIYGGNDYGVHDEKRCSDTERNSAGNNADDARQIRADEVGLSESAPPRDVWGDARNGDADTSPAGDGDVGESDGTDADRADNTEPWDNGTNEAVRPDDVGASDEQRESVGGGDGHLGDDTRLNIQENTITQTAGENSSQFFVSQELIDALLRLGGATKNSAQRIYSFYLRNGNADERIAFLKTEYESDSIGLIVGGKRAAAMWDDRGIFVAEGGSVAEADEISLLSWQDVDKRIWELIETGQYISRAEADKADEIWEDFVGDKVTYLYWDYFENIPEEYKSKSRKFMGFHDEKKFFIGVLKDPEKRDGLIREMRENIERLDEYPPRYKYVFKPEDALILAETFSREPVDVQPSSDYTLPPEHYVSQDKIDRELIGSETYVNNSKLEIYSFFLKETDNANRASFLSHHYGIGGAVTSRKWVDHDSKGLAITSGLDGHNNKTLLNWTKVSKRIAQLIDDDCYLNENEKATLGIESQNKNVKDATVSLSDYDISLGTVVNIGTTECTVLSLDGVSVELWDGTLIPLDMDMDTFIKRVSENPLNDHLKKKVEIKTLTAYKVGDFYEFYGDDAKTAANVLDFVLTSREINSERVPMCGFPFHQKDFYAQKLKENGYVFDVIDAPKTYTNDELERSKQLISDFIAAEYNGEAEIDDISEINIAYTETEDDGIPIQVDVNLADFSINKYLEDVLVSKKQYGSLKEMNDSALEYLDFGELVSVSDEEMDVYRESKAIPSPELLDDTAERRSAGVSDFHKDIPDDEKINYRIPEDFFPASGAKAKYNINIDAIKTLKKIESENRLATSEEQEILAKYSGWGGVPDAFDDKVGNGWEREYEELKNLLTPDEYAAAKESTLTAFFTPPEVIRAVYKALDGMGFKRGNILEPSCGIGNFIGMLPENMNESKFYGVELDDISGRIARQLYQKENIIIDGFERISYPDSFFDVAIGNVPFGNFGVIDKRYDKEKFLIHDYFFAKAIDKVRPGGVIAFITSSGTLDKADPKVRKYIAERADFLGAIRLPDNAFRSAGTRITTDIIFLQKRDRIIETEPEWVHLDKDENGIPMNSYFVQNPDMIMGEMVMRSGPFGDEPTCRDYENTDLSELLDYAVSNIHAEIDEVEVDELSSDEPDNTIPADPTVRNFSFTVVKGKVYYRQNSVMRPVDTTVTGENRIKGLIGLRDTVRKLIDAELHGATDRDVRSLQGELNRKYDAFTEKYGLINSRGNANVFCDDSSYFLLCSLEILDENKELKTKSDIFTKRTINPQRVIDKVDTASEALAVSLSERACVDLEYMALLLGGVDNVPKIVDDLRCVIFKLPTSGAFDFNIDGDAWKHGWQTADEYLSGNVREKLRTAKQYAEKDGFFDTNVKALEKIQPIDLKPTEIGVRLGSTWIPTEDVNDFMYELLGTPWYYKNTINVKYVPQTGQWTVTGKSHDWGNVKSTSVYGTSRKNAYEIIEDTLNLKTVKIFDYDVDSDGKRKATLNKKETTIAQGKQDQIKRAFEEWVWKDIGRRERLCALYNEKFNSIRPREYDGSHLVFDGMTPEISLRPHQKNAVARIIYGGNSLLGHVVGAGKTFTMVAAAQEMKRIGLCNKSMFVVPNHLIEQWASEYLQLYPSANILVATKKDFETKNRKKFCARIATGDYDAIIIGHSQFEKIPVSIERQMRMIQNEIDEIMLSIQKYRYDRGERVTVKQLEQKRKQLEKKLEKLNSTERKDDVVTFEELGVDRLFVDEAHYYKNLAAFTKMNNVAGIAQGEAQKSSDMYMKCRYMDEITGGKGIIFATGTPVSNTMVEMYTMQRYLQYDELVKRGIADFDSWASTFGETVTAIELAPDGSGYRAKTRFSKFFNLPELISMFKQVADIQTSDMLNLPVPKANYNIVKVEASDIQKDLVQSFSERAERVHNRMVNANEDNMLLITSDGRKAALDQRLINPTLPDDENSKVNACVNNIYDIWEKNAETKAAQLVFCDLSTPKGDGKFNVYDDIRAKLIERGVPADEIAFIHTADTDTKKKDLFGKVRSGKVRVLIGSTFKMGAGTNVQERLIALHDLDVPWRPSDLEQRSGRIVRQGNSNPEVFIYRYITQGTFDAYSYQTLETKQKFISQIFTSKSPVRSAEDIDETALSYAEIKALASGNPKIMEKMQLDADVAKLKLQKAAHLSQRYSLESDLARKFPKQIAETEERIKGYERDIETADTNTHPSEKGFSPMVIFGETISEKADAGRKILEICKKITTPEPRPLGNYRGFKTELGFDTMEREFFINLIGKLTHKVKLGDDANGIITRMDNMIESFKVKKENCNDRLKELHIQIENAKAEIEKPFPDEEILQEKSMRLDEINAELNLDHAENELDDGEKSECNEKEEVKDERNER